ncbi:SERTA domain-containing protein 1-like [Ambystoma mexicanum]|uniref:SERTA domain-containing protein 1-like n=1 Tax=Ambystoma mexicanum TaxID=8296 RepID=UPI0037E74CEF
MLAKGVKRKYCEVDGRMDATPEAASTCTTSLAAVQSNSLLNISLVKLHQSLKHVEPNLRHLVLVANTLRRLQGDVQGDQSSRAEQNSEGTTSRMDHSVAQTPTVLPSQKCDGSEAGKKVPMEDHEQSILISSFDTSLYSSISTILEDLSHIEGLCSSPLQVDEDQLGCLKASAINTSGSWEEMGRSSHPLVGPLELLSSTSYLDDNLEDIFSDIDTSMYDCDPWPATGLLNFRAFSNTEDSFSAAGQNGRLELSELDYLMDVLVGTQTC